MSFYFKKYILKIVFILLGILSLLYIYRLPTNLGSYLPLLVGFGIIILEFLYQNRNKNKTFNILYKIMIIGFIYFIITFSIFCFNISRNRTVKIDEDFDSIIVLGAGLYQGRYVSGTLAYRLEKAIEIYNVKKVPIVVSGGQGDDELVSEAFAMKEYLVQKGIDENSIYLEDRSTTTEENFKFSKEILDSIFQDEYKIVFTSNDFHISRAEKYMKKAGLEGYGVGTKSATVRIPANYLREYIVTHVYYIKSIFN